MNIHQSFLWPDHAISKRDSRSIRESHNAAINALYRMETLTDDQERAMGEKIVRSFGLVKRMDPEWSEPRYIVDGSTFTALGVFRRFAHIVKTIQETGEYPA